MKTTQDVHSSADNKTGDSIQQSEIK